MKMRNPLSDIQWTSRSKVEARALLAFVFLGFFLACSFPAQIFAQGLDKPCFPPGHYECIPSSLLKDYGTTSKAHFSYSPIDQATGNSFSLLNHLKYEPAERDQGSCSNGWIWAGTGVLSIALHVQERVFDRLSVQFATSCRGADNCCDSSMLSDLVSFYGSSGHAVPWSNTNAQWQDGDGQCNVSCGSIATSPSYAIESISLRSIETHDLEQSDAIANIKEVLHQNKAVWFGWILPTETAWQEFQNFWETQAEDQTLTLNYCCGHT